MSDIVEPRITGINKSIIDSYQNLGGINHITGPNLPSRRGVIAILETFESLIFPGFQAEEKLEDDLISYTIGAKTRRLVRELTVEISRSLEYEVRSEGRESVPGTCRKEAEKIALNLLELIPSLRERAMRDVEAAYTGDPAAKSRDEVILSYPGLEAVACYRVAHELYIRDVPLIPRMMSEHVHKNTGIDIHPGAQIDDGFFIDHATGVVVGETSVIGKNVKLYQGVTIGALSVAKELADKKRHPTIEDNVTIYAGATILGGKTVIGKGSVIGGNVWITSSVPAFSVVYNRPADYRVKNRYAEGNSADHWSI
ncbi:MAG: serine O-acetyltransferase EpsC [Spirochaetaceae bacterium]|nr:serine O-acetyltransferase [Spirochaetaceae bacterium]MDT8298979.1 serine O-acetyltransferase EpsC [Spirochaetaceae bacterium]